MHRNEKKRLIVYLDVEPYEQLTQIIEKYKLTNSDIINWFIGTNYEELITNYNFNLRIMQHFKTEDSKYNKIEAMKENKDEE